MRELVKLTFFCFLFIVKSIPAISQQFLWTTNNNGLFANTKIKVISKEEVFDKVLSYYEIYNAYYDVSGFNKNVFLNKIENSLKLKNKSKWVDFKKSISNLKETNIACVKSNDGNSSMVMVLIFNKNNFDAIIFSNELKAGYISTYNSMIEDAKNRFVKFFESLIGYSKSTNPISEKTKDGLETNGAFVIVQNPAEFPGGNQGWDRYLERTLDLNLLVKNGAPAGKYSVTVSFIIGKDGSISEIKAENDPGYGIKEEMIRVIQKGPNWKPAVQNGRNVVYRKHFSFDFVIK